MTAEITRGDGSIEVRSPAPRSRRQPLIVLSWAPFMAAGAVATYVTVSTFSSRAAKGPGGLVGGLLFILFSLIVFLGCVAGAVVAVYGLVGRERVHADSSGMTLYEEMAGLRFRQHFPRHRVRHVRVFVPPAEEGGWSPPPSRVIFDTPGRVKGFGSGLTAEQAAEVASAVAELVEAPAAAESGS